MELHLKVKFPEDGNVVYYILKEPENLIGRDPSCDICLNDINVSSYHAHIFIRNNKFWSEDGFQGKPSRNGTWVNNKRIIEPVTLRRGDIFLIGTCRMQVTDVVSLARETEEMLVPQGKKDTTDTISLEDFHKMQLGEINDKPLRGKQIILASAILSILFVLLAIFLIFRVESIAIPVRTEIATETRWENVSFVTFSLPGKNFNLRSPFAGKVTEIIKKEGEFVHLNDTILRFQQKQEKGEVQKKQEALEKLRKHVHKLQGELPKIQIEIEKISTQLKSIEQQVKKAEELLSIGKVDYESVESKKEQEQNVRQQLEIQQNFYREKSQQLQRGEQSFLRIQEDFLKARKDLDKTIVSSPISGYISNFAINQTDTIVPGQAICRLIDTRLIKLCLHLPQDEFPGWEEKEEVSVHFPKITYPKSFPGKVLSSSFRSESGSPIVEIIIDVQNNEETIKTGMEAKIEGKKKIESNWPLIAKKALVLRSNIPYVFVIENNSAYLRRITIKEKYDSYLGVKGVKVGDQVVLAPPLQLAEGKKVELLNSELNQ